MPQGIEHGRLVECLPKELLKLTCNFTESLVVPKIPESLQTWVFLNIVGFEDKALISLRITGLATTKYDYYKETSGNEMIFFETLRFSLECLP